MKRYAMLRLTRKYFNLLFRPWKNLTRGRGGEGKRGERTGTVLAGRSDQRTMTEGGCLTKTFN
jgi:hypothetical protein